MEEEKKYVLPQLKYSIISLIKEKKINCPRIYTKSEVLEIIKPIRNLINQNDKRRKA